MFGKHIYDSRALMEIKRYQNRIMHNKRSVAEHLASTAIIAQWLALIETNLFGNKVDMTELLQRAINHNVTQIEVGNIINSTKTRIPEMQVHIKANHEHAYDSIISLDIPKSWRKDFRRFILNAKDDSLEGNILAAADLIDCVLECVQEIKLKNEEYFTTILINVADKLTKFNIKSVQYFLKYCISDFGLNIEKYFGIDFNLYINSLTFSEQNIHNYFSCGRYIYKARDLMELLRYQNRRMFTRRSVMEHTWSVCKIAQGLAIWTTKKFGISVDMSELLQRALNHDVLEKDTGDILSPTKRMMEEAVEGMEIATFNAVVLPDIPHEIREDFIRYILHPKDNTIEGKIIAAADSIDAMLECISEIKLGNDEHFSGILRRVAETIVKIDADCVKYFLKYSLTDFGLNIEKYYGSSVYDYIKHIEFDDSVFITSME